MYNAFFGFSSIALFLLAYVAKTKDKAPLKTVLAGFFALAMSAWAAYIPSDWNPITMIVTSCIFIVVIAVALRFLYSDKGDSSKTLWGISFAVAFFCVVFCGWFFWIFCG